MAAFLALTGGAATLLWILAVVLVIAGIVSIVRGGVLAGIVLIIVGLLVGPGGVSIFCATRAPPPLRAGGPGLTRCRTATTIANCPRGSNPASAGVSPRGSSPVRSWAPSWGA